MSHIYCTELWLETLEDLKILTKLDKSILDGEKILKPEEVANALLDIYLRYRRIVQRLIDCHQRILQPQIRKFMKKILEYSIVRMLEYRRELFDVTRVKYFCPNENLIKMKITHDDVDLLGVGSCQLETRNEYIDALINESIGPEKFDISQTDIEKEESCKHAISLIQLHERTRVARNIAARARKRMEDLKKVPEEESAVERSNKADKMARAAIIIQKVWRGFCARRQVKIKLEKIEEVLGMIQPIWKSDKIFKDAFMVDVTTISDQKAAVEKLKKTSELEKERIWKDRGPGLVEDIQDEIRVWYLQWFEELGVFDFIPKVEEGGSILIASGQARTPSEYLASLTASDDKKPPEEIIDDIPVEDDEEEEWSMQESKVLDSLLQTDEEFMDSWYYKIDEMMDPNGVLIMDFVKDELCYDLQLKMRRVADDAMRTELEMLNKALLQDHAQDKGGFPLPKKAVYPDPLLPTKNTRIKRLQELAIPMPIDTTA